MADSVNKVIRDRSHLAFVRILSCMTCGIMPSQAAHIRFGGENKGKGGMGMKPGDNRVVPLCDDCHKVQGRSEPEFWERAGISDPLVFAERIYAVTGDETAARAILFERHFS